MSIRVNFSKHNAKLGETTDRVNLANQSVLSGWSPGNLNRSTASTTWPKSPNNSQKKLTNNEFLKGDLDAAKIEEYM